MEKNDFINILGSMFAGITVYLIWRFLWGISQETSLIVAAVVAINALILCEIEDLRKEIKK